MEPTSTDTTTGNEAASFWEKHYRARKPSTNSRVNPVLAEIVGALTPGTALDLGCGAGGDALWLADRGWRVTAVDISDTAVRRLAENARARGFGSGPGDPEALISAQRIDLAEDFPAGEFDLISAQYFHTPFALPRARVLRAAALALRSGGRLVVVDHGSTAPWSWNQDPGIHFPTPNEVFTELALDSDQWLIERADMPSRRASGPNGETATVVDNVLVIRRTK